MNTPEISSDSICQESDGCPTELAVLQKYWRENQASNKDAELYKHRRFIEVSNRLALQGVMAISPELFKKELDQYDKESETITHVTIDFD